MKKLGMLFCVLMTLAVIPVTAQNTPEAKARVAEIRKLYTNAKESIAFRKEAELPPDEMVINNSYMAAGAGPIKEVYHYYYSGDYKEDFGDFYEVYFITHSHNVGAMEYYEEVLYDNDGAPAFYYEHSPEGEFRYYFDKWKVIHEISTGKDPRKEYDEELLLLQRYCADLTNAFNSLMNRNYE